MACNNDANCKWCPKCDGSLWSGNADDKCVDIGTCSYQTGTDNDLDGYNVECDLDCDDDISDDPTGCQGITSCSTLTFECAMCINLGAQEYWGNGDNIDNDCDGYVIPSDYSTQFTAQADVDDLYLLIKDEIGGDCPSCVFDDDALRLTQIQNFASGIPSTQVSEIISDLITAVQNDPDLSTKPDKQAFLEDALNYLAGRITYYGG